MNAIISLLTVRVLGPLLVVLYCSCATAAPGDPVIAFGQNGLRYPLDTLPQFSASSHLAVAGDGSIYVVGECSNVPSNAACVRKLNAVGGIDTSYAVSGYRSLVVSGFTLTRVVGVALSRRDGTLAVAGVCNNATTTQRGSCIVRFDASGTTLPVHAPGGIGQDVFFDNLDVASFVQRPSGALTIAGSCAITFAFCMTSLVETGSVSITGLSPLGSSSTVLALLARPDGGLWLVTRCYDGQVAVVCLTKFIHPGSVDTTFGNAGTLYLLETGNSARPFDYVTAALLQPDGKIVLAGNCDVYRTCVKRYNVDGSIDTGWAVSGSLPNTVVVSQRNGDGAVQAIRDALAIQGDGKILLATTYRFTSLSNADSRASQIYVLRLSSDGSSSGSDYRNWSTNFWNGVFANSAASDSVLMHDDALLVLGTCKSSSVASSPLQPCLVKLQGGPLNYARCSGDIDGDGLVTPVVDSLILTRIALGFTGDAVTQGVAFAPHAARKTWSLMREHLIGQCGMALP
jgi:uncharacterized delta-60 repeat protein